MRAPIRKPSMRLYGEASVESADSIQHQSGFIRVQAACGERVEQVFSRRDGVVSWQACIDRVSPYADHVEVSSTHIGLGIDPDVWRIVADRLAASSDSLQPAVGRGRTAYVRALSRRMSR